MSAVLACQPTAAGVLAPPEVDQFSRSFIETLRSGTAAELQPFIGAEATADSLLLPAVERMRATFLPGAPDTAILVSAEVVHESGKPLVRELTYYVATGPDTVRVELWVEEAPAGRLVETFKVRRLSGP